MRALAIMLCVLVMVHSSVAAALDGPTKGLLFPMFGKNNPCGPSGSGGGGKIDITGDNVKDTYAFLMSSPLSFTSMQTAGIVGNLLWESGLDYKAEQKQGGNAKGIAQWEGGRFDNLVAYAASQGKEWNSDLQVQLEFLRKELLGSEKAAYTATRATTTVEEATTVFLQKFERAGIPHADKRLELANEAYARYGSSITVPGGGGTTTGASACGGFDSDPDNIFGSSASMTCQIGRDGGIQDGYRDGVKIRIRICVVGGIEVNAKIEQNVAALLKARSMGGGGFRSMEEQIQTRINNGCPDIYNSPSSACRVPTARPGYSNHQMGLAIDFDLKSGDFDWLSANAAKYGLKNFPKEAWHWSVDGT